MNKSEYKKNKTQSGFTLLEMLIALSLASLLMGGAMALLLSASRSTVRTQAQIFATGDAANSIQSVIGLLRAAHSFAMPTSATANTGEYDKDNPEERWITPTGVTLDRFSLTLNPGTANAEVINTGIEITAPPTLIGPTNNYNAGINDIQVRSTSGGSWTVTPYNTQGVGTGVTLIYRGDPDGTPDPDPTGSTLKNAGTYLWRYDLPADKSFNPAVYPPTALCKSVSSAPNAVQFVRPAYSGVAEQNQVEVKIISGYYSPINGTQTSEESAGASTSQLTGKCVYMRDHATTGAPSNAGTRSSNNVFQYR